jgi:AcrR family transcriptional regulator
MPYLEVGILNLNREDWIKAGLNSLAESGIEAVRVEALARQLQISKGSFYHHFKDRQELIEAMLTYWEEFGTRRTIVEIESGRPAYDKLNRLLDLSFTTDKKLESAIYSWANQDSAVAERVSKIEQERIQYLAKLYSEAGFASSEAQVRAEITYFVYLGWVDRISRDPKLSLELSIVKKTISKLFAITD